MLVGATFDSVSERRGWCFALSWPVNKLSGCEQETLMLYHMKDNLNPYLHLNKIGLKNTYLVVVELCSFKGIHDRHVQTAERCLDGIYWCLTCLVWASQTVILPSCVVSANSCPEGLNLNFSFVEVFPTISGTFLEIAFEDPNDAGSEVAEVILAV